MLRVFFPLTALVLLTAPAFAQSSTINATGSAAVPTTSSPPAQITLGIAAASAANDRPAPSSAYGTTLAANMAAEPAATPGRLRTSTR